jgi:CubicO group peptidase (beta-lactamase class C family)
LKIIILACTIFLSLVVSSCEKTILGPDAEQPSPVVHQSKLATILDSMRYAYKLPALAGAIVTDTGIIDAQAVGCRRYGGAVNITNNDQFHLGSCTKSFTAVLIGTLIDEGVFTWDTKLTDIFPEIAGSMRAEYKDVTIRNVLSHSAGFIRDPNFELKTNTLQEQRKEIVDWALKQPPVNLRGQ